MLVRLGTLRTEKTVHHTYTSLAWLVSKMFCVCRCIYLAHYAFSSLGHKPHTLVYGHILQPYALICCHLPSISINQAQRFSVLG